MAYICEVRNAFGISGATARSGNSLHLTISSSRLRVRSDGQAGNFIYSTSSTFIEDELKPAITSITGHTDIVAVSATMSPNLYAGDVLVQGGGVPEETAAPITDVLCEYNFISYSHLVDGFLVNNQISIPNFRTYWEFLDILRGASGEPIDGTLGFLVFPAEVEIACLDIDSLEDTTITLDINSIPPTLTVVDGDPGDIYITINAEDGSPTPFNDLDPFYQDRVRDTVERVLLETDGVDIRTWALESDFLHTSLETMDLNELVEILTHVAVVGRD